MDASLCSRWSIWFCVVFCKVTTGDGATLFTPDHTVYLGDTVRLTCAGGYGEILHFYRNQILVQRDPRTHYSRQNSKSAFYDIHIKSKSDGGWFSCGASEETQSGVKELRVREKSRSVELTVVNTPVEDRVTLGCSVEDWKENVQWFFRNSSSPYSELNNDKSVLTVSRGGVYSCRGAGDGLFRGESNEITVESFVPRVDPSLLQVCLGDSLTLRCNVGSGVNTDWTFHWSRKRLNFSPTTRDWTESRETRDWTVSRVRESDTGAYSCRAERGPHTTVWSRTTNVTVHMGGRVTLTCVIQRPSPVHEEYRWFRGKEDQPEELRETSQSISVSRGGEYSCRGQTQFGFTARSLPVSLKETDAASTESLSVSPDRTQHFTDDIISLSCGFNSTGAEYKRYSDNKLSAQTCSSMRKDKCDFSLHEKTSAVFWCESRTGEMSNAINISAHSDIILVSPVGAVTEGQSVSLSCKLKEGTFTSVIFYKDGKMVQNGTESELSISAASRSDEGLYKCEGQWKPRQPSAPKTGMSPESWVSVQTAPVSKTGLSSVPVMWVVGPVCSVVLLILLLLLWSCIKTKDTCFLRTQTTNQSSAEDHVTSNDVTTAPSAPPTDVTYSELELKSLPAMRNTPQNETCMYSRVNLRSSGEDVTYAQVNRQKKKLKKEKSHPTSVSEIEQTYW